MEQKPGQVHENFVEAFNRHDLDAIAALYEPEAVMVSSAGPVRGIAAIREIYRAVFALRPTIELRTLGAHQTGDLALLHGKWIWRGVGPDGVEVRREGYNTETVRRQPDGRWLFAIDNPSAPR